MRRNIMRRVSIGFLYLGSVFCCSASPWTSVAAETQYIAIGTGSVGGRYFSLGVDLCSVINRKRNSHGIWCGVEASVGADDNYKRLAEKSIEMAFLQSDTLDDLPDYEEVINPIMFGYEESLNVIVSRYSEIGSLIGVKGNRVNIGPKGSGTRELALKTLDAAQITPDDYHALELEASNLKSALCGDEVDVVFWVAGYPNRITQGLLEECGGRLINIDRDVVVKIVSENLVYLPLEIPESTYIGMEGSVSTFGGGSYLAAGVDVDITTLDTIKKIIKEYEGELEVKHNNLNIEIYLK